MNVRVTVRRGSSDLIAVDVRRLIYDALAIKGDQIPNGWEVEFTGATVN